jgi:hypothetical protein
MSFILLLAGAGLIAVGVDLGLLSRHAGQLPSSEIDRIVYGDHPPELTLAARAAIARRFIVQPGASTRTLAALVAVAGAALLAVGLGVWS